MRSADRIPIRMIMRALIVFVAFTVSVQAGPAEDIFRQRGTTGLPATATALRDLLQRDPKDAETRYYLASTLIEDADSLGKVTEALTMLDGLEKESTPRWLAAWALARRMQAAVRLQQLNRTTGPTLPESARATTSDPGFQAFLRTELAALDTALAPIRDMLKRAETLGRKSFTAEDVRADLQQLETLLRTRWAYVEEKERQTGTSLADVIARALTEVRPEMPRAEVIALLRRCVASLEDGHTSLSIDDAPQSTRLPFRAIETSDGILILEAAAESTLQRGDLVLTLDGAPVEDVIRTRGELYPVSTAAARRAHGIALLHECPDGRGKVRVEIEREGVRKTIELSAAPPSETRWKCERERAPWISSRRLQPEVGYVRITSWAPGSFPGDAIPAAARARQEFFAPALREIDEAMRPLADCATIILDVRGNRGGYDPLACYLGSYFLADRPVKPYILRYRAAPGDGKATGVGADGFFNESRRPAEYEGTARAPLTARVCILVDELCFSATDTFLHLLTLQMSAGRVTTIGRPSNGGIGGPTSLGNLTHTGAALTASTCRAYSLTGSLLEGNPARLDERITWTRADVLAGRDADMEAALARASRR